jgi:hypothetical protein
MLSKKVAERLRFPVLLTFGQFDELVEVNPIGTDGV